MTASTTRQPKALYLLASVQMWECFSFYGMRALLVLYMINEMQISDLQAFGVYAVYSGLVDLGSVVGGIVADKLLGLRRAIAWGGWLIAAGHIIMTFEGIGNSFFVGLALIVVGSSLFSTNISALLGLYYKQTDDRREAGYTLFYMSINCGAFLASVICGTVGETFGWHYGFGIAAIGMIIGNIAFLSLSSLLEDKGLTCANRLPVRWKTPIGLIAAIYAVSFGIAHGDTLLPLLPILSLACIGYIVWKLIALRSIPSDRLFMLLVYLLALGVFYAAEEQIGSTLMLFNERHVSKTFIGIGIPSSFLLGINPATIILLGPFVMRACGRFFSPSSFVPWRLMAALALCGGAFAWIAFASAFPDSSGQVAFVQLALGIMIISGAELLITPVVYSYCSELAPQEQQGTVMGLVPIGFSLGSFGGGLLSSAMAVPENSIASLDYYSLGYGLTAILLWITVVILLLVVYKISYYRKATL